MKRLSEKSSGEGSHALTTFVLKTYSILNSPENASAIAWNADGSSFTIKNVHLLMTKVLPLYFRHHKYESFIRQLNMYSFAKVKAVNGPTFANPHFRRDREDLLKFIKRKPEKKKREREQSLQEDSSTQKLSGESQMISKPMVRFEQSRPLLENENGSNSPSHRTTASDCAKIGVSRNGLEGLGSQGEESCSGMIEPSCKWLGRKECWQDIRSYRSIVVSMALLQGEGQLGSDNV